MNLHELGDRGLAGYIDHTLLKPEAGPNEIARLCEEAAEFGFYSVCVHSDWTSLCRRELEGTGVKISVVCGFPLGASATAVKAYEAQYSVDQGADEIDMVMAIGRLKAGHAEAVRADIREVVKAANGQTVKVILETGLLLPEEIHTACQLAAEAGAHFVKTSTGFGKRGATLDDVVRMKESSPERMRIKAAGGIRTREDAFRFIQAGASRLGTSAGPALMEGSSAQNEY